MDITRITVLCIYKQGFPGGLAGREYSCNAGDSGLIPRRGRSPGEGTHYPFQYSWTSLVGQMVKNPPTVWETLGLTPELGQFPGGGHGNPLQYSCLENLHGQRSLAGYSPWGHRELDMTERLSTAHSIHSNPVFNCHA